jgi:hypothetical protein
MAFGFNIKDVAAAAAKTTDMTKATAGGGDYQPPAVGHPNLRFVGYFELGDHEEKFGVAKGKVKKKVQLVFELSGPKYPARDTDGGKVPVRMSIDMTLSLNEKATFFKTFKAMNDAHGGKATHIAELLGAEFKGTVEHKEKEAQGKKRTYANLVNIRKAEIEDPDSGEMRPVKVDPPLTEIKGFIWDFATPEMWDSIFIPGEYEERKNDKGEVTAPAKSKNVIQLKIASALNFKACPIFDYAKGKIKAEDLAALDAALDESGAGDADDEAKPDRPDPMADVA